MSSTFRNKSAEIVYDSDLLKQLEKRVGIRYVVFDDEDHEPHCKAYLFGHTGHSLGFFFWVEISGYLSRVMGNGQVKLTMWNQNIPGNLVQKFTHWEEKTPDYPWWATLVSDQLFEGTKVSVDKKTLVKLDPTDHSLQFFHGLFSANILSYHTELEQAGRVHEVLRPQVLALSTLATRFCGFTAETYRQTFDH